VTDDELLAELSQLRPDIGPERIAELRGLPQELRRPLLDLYATQDWTPPSEAAGARFLAIVQALGGVAGSVGQVAGAVAGVKGAV
jgi:hypothetical protein